MTTATRKAAPRRVPAKPKDLAPPEPEVSLVDQMGADAEQVEIPTEYPAGVPAFKVLLAVRPRGRRGEFKRLLAQISELSNTARTGQAEMAALTNEDAKRTAMFRVSAAIDDVLEVVEKALRLVAVDTAEFDAWAAEVSDEDLQTTWTVYQTRTQPGEASSSTS